jgi:hypothetical protein
MEYTVKVKGLVEIWYLNGEKVKEIKYYENGNKQYEEYYLNDKIHRENGPASQGWYEIGNKQYEIYYLNGKEVSKEEVMKPKKTINIGGKEVSEDTILMALKEYFK